MFQTRSLSTGFLVASLSLAAGLAFLGSPNLAAADGCGDIKASDVQNYCNNKGGVAAVKKQMKAAMDAANKDLPKDKQLKCTSCHEDQEKYKPKGDASAGFDKSMKSAFCANAADCAKK